MEQHPVPQNISSYEFRLVGDMTLKQFLQLAIGIILAVIAFRLPLPAFIRYPAVFIFLLFGVLMAFVPINGRPFTAWILAFIKAIYSPTEFVWVPSPEEVVAPALSPTPATPAAPARQFLNFSSFFSSHLPKTPTSPPPPAAIPIPEPSPAPEIAPPGKDTQTTSLPEIVPSPSFSPTPPQTVFTAPPLTPPPPPITPPPTAPPLPTPTPTNVAPDLSLAIPTPIAHTAPSSLPPGASITDQVSAPTSANILAGLVADSHHQSLPGATIEIIDAATGIPTRALRTNRLGQFQIAIPLPPGSYIIHTEKEGLNFDPVTIKAAGTIIPPIQISARAA